jgi:hypothetical protein
MPCYFSYSFLIRHRPQFLGGHQNLAALDLLSAVLSKLGPSHEAETRALIQCGLRLCDAAPDSASAADATKRAKLEQLLKKLDGGGCSGGGGGGHGDENTNPNTHVALMAVAAPLMNRSPALPLSTAAFSVPPRAQAPQAVPVHHHKAAPPAATVLSLSPLPIFVAPEPQCGPSRQSPPSSSSSSTTTSSSSSSTSSSSSSANMEMRRRWFDSQLPRWPQAALQNLLKRNNCTASGSLREMHERARHAFDHGAHTRIRTHECFHLHALVCAFVC